ncbi:unnamed protein product [Bursaphelenchus xylophilus]|uniref:(pine wood nematode) hypothetical protein n=1 Tax=Bursaphelenchus xylophilus TaxID=6326 RepID=A0A1I7S2H2_BURXY|nr:unnamed protein product [Bursaphelenchus xylophilus]CAG9114549.1 unnamed protein product [Bursaphelenchus xylophilus]
MASEDDRKSPRIDPAVWVEQLKRKREIQLKNIKFLQDNPHLEEGQIRRLDSTLKRVTGFKKKVKSIGSTVSPDSLIADLSKLNLSNYIDEIAQCVVDSKMKVEDLEPLIQFCVAAGQIYSQFSSHVVAELKKQMPTKKSDTLKNPAKLRVDLKFLSDLIMNGVVKSEGIQLLGQVLGYLIQTDKADHLNMSVLMPFCKFSYFDCSNVPPLFISSYCIETNDLEADVLSKNQKAAIKGLFGEYWTSLVDHLNDTRTKMNGLLKFIKRQERTRGDASQDDRNKYENLKSQFDRLHAQATEFAPWIGKEVPEMPEELSDDEADNAEARRLHVELSEGKQSLWPDDDTRTFYEHLYNVEHATLLAAQNTTLPTEEENELDGEEISEESIESEVDNVDMEELEYQDTNDEAEQIPEQETEEATNVEEEVDTPANDEQNLSPFFQPSGPSTTMAVFLQRLSNGINRERIDACAVEFITNFNRRSNRKKLIQHLLSAPYDRLDLLPFYSRFMATIKPSVKEVPHQVCNGLLERFRAFARKSPDMKKRTGPPDRSQCIDAKVHVSKYVAEIVKFKLLPKAEGLACLRSLLVDLKGYKVDMLCAMVESMGPFMYKSPESHAKMKVVLTVMNTKSHKIKDSRQKLLLENAYFCVLPPEEEIIQVNRRPPMEEYISKNVLTGHKPLRVLRRVDWLDSGIREFTLKLLTDACGVPFSGLERLAKVVSALSDHQPWVGVYVVDEVLEFIRLALEVEDPTLHQRLFSSVVYIGQLFNYTVCGTLVIFKVLYQVISLGITTSYGALLDCALRVRRIRLTIEMVKVVGEFFGDGKSKERMDCFLNYLLLFYYDTKSYWSQYTEELGEFPLDVDYELEKILKKFRPTERDSFPKSIEEAREAVQAIQLQYKDKAEQLLRRGEAQTIHTETIVEEKPRKLFCITEDDDEEGIMKTSPQQAEEEAEPSPVQTTFKKQFDSFGDEDEEELEIKKESVVTEEDEDFMKEYERVLSETFQTSVIPKVPVIDLEVPPSARQKFERKITFADANEPAEPKAREPQMALMTRKGNRTILKAVNLKSSEGMQNALLEQKEKQEKERKEMKHITLAMDERMYQQQEADLLANSLSNMRVVGQRSQNGPSLP